VVGVLLAAFCHPVWTAAITDWRSLGLALLAIAALLSGRIPVWLVVGASAALGGWLL
jgi:chromate transporter